MKRKIVLFLFLVCLFVPDLYSQADSIILTPRQYRLVIGQPYESEIFATAGLTFYKGFQDLYQRAIAPHLPPKLENITEVLWSMNWSFIFTMWPHDGGHWVRARQVGGDFIITRFGYPFPVAEMHLPEDLGPEYQTLSSIGGHEINFLMRQQIHTGFYVNRYAFADELIHGFVQDMLYPLYAYVIIYTNPKKPNVWLDTRGDPVESTLSVFRKYTGREPVMGDGSVDPELISMYREKSLLGLFWPVLNPMFFRGLKSFGMDMSDNFGLVTRPWMLGNEKFSWSWGTHFNPSPLGYELYLQNYFLLHDKLYMLYLRYGRPYMNTGIGIQVPRLVDRGAFKLGVSADAWTQDIYGNGVAFTLNPEYQPAKGFGLIAKAGWKSEGYLVGRKVDPSFLLLGGCSFSF